jgi:hypothetical protein
MHICHLSVLCDGELSRHLAGNTRLRLELSSIAGLEISLVFIDDFFDRISVRHYAPAATLVVLSRKGAAPMLVLRDASSRLAMPAQSIYIC